jgi:hypothetical protein
LRSRSCSVCPRWGRDGDELPGALYNILHFRISNDISHLRGSRYMGERFDSAGWAFYLEQARRNHLEQAQRDQEDC